MTETKTQLLKNNQSKTNSTVIHRELNDSKENILDFESKLNENNQNIGNKNALTSKLESLTLKSTKIQMNIEANNGIMNALNTDIKKLTEAKVEPNPIKNYKISVSLSTLMKDDISVVISYFKSLPTITDKELNGLESLYKHIINDEASKELANELFLEDIVMTYFSTLHPTNPTPINSWKRLTTLLKKKPFKDVNMDDIKAFLKGGLISFGYDKQEYPIWFIQSQNYNENQPVNAMSYAVRIWIYSIFCDRNKNSFDLKQMRRGLHYYTDMKAWSLRLISWKVLIALRDCQYGVPYGIENAYAINLPFLIKVLKNLADKIAPKHAVEKVKFLKDKSEFFNEFNGIKDQTPAWADGTSKMKAIDWVQKRGYLNEICFGLSNDIQSK